MQAGLGRRAGGLDAQGLEDEAITRLRPERTERAVVVQHDERRLGPVLDKGPCRFHLGVKFRGPLAGKAFLLEDPPQRHKVVLDDFDVIGLAVAIVHVEVDRRRDLAQRFVVVRLQRSDQDQVGPGGMHAFQVRLHDSAHVLHLRRILVAGKKVRHKIFGHADDRHAKFVQEVDFVHIQGHHTLRQLFNDGRAQFVLNRDAGVGL
ncbi:hypothetical protein ACMZ4X_03365 [Achromobacter marplatensis]